MAPPSCVCACEVHLQCFRDVIFQLYGTHKSYLMSNNMLSVILPFVFLDTAPAEVCVCVCISDNVFVLSEYTPADMVCVFGDTLKHWCGTKCLMACFRISVKMGHVAVELNSSASRTRVTEIQLLIKQHRSQQRLWSKLAATDMSLKLYNLAHHSVTLMLFIILNSLLTDPLALWCHCSSQSTVGLLIHTTTVIHCGRTHKPLCCFHLYN